MTTLIFLNFGQFRKLSMKSRQPQKHRKTFRHNFVACSPTIETHAKTTTIKSTVIVKITKQQKKLYSSIETEKNGQKKNCFDDRHSEHNKRELRTEKNSSKFLSKRKMSVVKHIPRLMVEVQLSRQNSHFTKHRTYTQGANEAFEVQKDAFARCRGVIKLMPNQRRLTCSVYKLKLYSEIDLFGRSV